MRRSCLADALGAVEVAFSDAAAPGVAGAGPGAGSLDGGDMEDFDLDLDVRGATAAADRCQAAPYSVLALLCSCSSVALRRGVLCGSRGQDLHRSAWWPPTRPSSMLMRSHEVATATGGLTCRCRHILPTAKIWHRWGACTCCTDLQQMLAWV